MSKIDELKQVYDAAEDAAQCVAIPGESFIDMMHRAQLAGIAAVVRALRDECDRVLPCDRKFSRNQVWDVFEEILAPREGGSREAGVPTSDGGTELDRTSGPAPAAPAPVCEWLDDGNPRKRRRNSCGLQGANQSWAGMNWVCTGCLRPIKFTEAQR